MEIDKQTITLNNGSKDVSVIVYLKEIMVKNNHKTIKDFISKTIKYINQYN